MRNPIADVVVIGGGAAGMMAAVTAAERGLKVTVVERNSREGAPLVCRKLGITGKGRCNLTNDCSVKECVQNIPTNGKFLYSCLNAFSPAQAISFFEAAGVPLKTERGRRVFPQSDKASDVVRALKRLASDLGVKTVPGRAKRIVCKDGKVCGVEVGENLYSCRAAVLATGGLSYPLTGSSGDGYEMAKVLGHTVTAVRGSLVPLVSPDGYCADMQGLSLKNVQLKAVDEKGKVLYEQLGEMLFTHFGVSGPLVLSASAHLRDYEAHSYRLLIDLKPGLDREQLDARILRDISQTPNRSFLNLLGGLVNGKMIPVIAELSGIPGDLQANSVTKQQRRALVELLKCFPVKVSGPRPVEEAIITTGGINVLEIDPRSMQSRFVEGLFFAGEIIDADGYTGGYNLQIAWSTGRMAGMCVCAQQEE